MTDQQNFAKEKYTRLRTNCLIGLLLSLFLAPVFIGFLLFPLSVYGLVQANNGLKKLESEINA